MRAYRNWFYAAAVYNFVWGTWIVLFPLSFFRLLGLPETNYVSIWQSVGMMVLVYALGYWMIARDPVRYAGYVWIGLIGKTFGPIGFVMAALQGQLPWRFGFTILTNDVIWWPAFWMFALKYAVKPMREVIAAETPDNE